eukprot:CAMPEP_0177737406 /NCGR_PEP_ID=MMETSP0484_2-20121128/25868_1 /TAXON_ID=354590 /ORGANISM="Rhodomonas lens, Strain RHODO" /LENGTH=143 /DNA_ID=CAMNT_0019251185 /DNA_START=35 /DNA_END=464 /DNA_ORIENTATION=+
MKELPASMVRHSIHAGEKAATAGKAVFSKMNPSALGTVSMAAGGKFMDAMGTGAKASVAAGEMFVGGISQGAKVGVAAGDMFVSGIHQLSDQVVGGLRWQSYLDEEGPAAGGVEDKQWLKAQAKRLAHEEQQAREGEGEKGAG